MADVKSSESHPKIEEVEHEKEGRDLAARLKALSPVVAARVVSPLYLKILIYKANEYSFYS
jgi:hypothetical protein